MRKVLISVLAAASLLLAPTSAASAATATHTAAGWCAKKQPDGRYIYKHGKHWDCVSPGAFCASYQHGGYGYSRHARAHAKRYKCVRYTAKIWRWKAA
ncbi:hypothetical protein Pta02_11910 [Planobispora takensis]|uniref:Uncharacterized protein n=1 Tax=Planobispora takensis TaxID=1367882 RepID=A0A8J3WSE8_9ACTN|nr:hypothetical protein Pta02_11910 [Planobispora takensis]